MRKKSLWLMISLGVLLLLSGIALAGPVNLVFEHNLTTDHPWQAGAEYMAEKIAEGTNGAYKVKIYPNGTLSNRDWNVMLEHTEKGISAMMVEGVIPFSTLVPEFGAFQLPFLFENNEHFTRFAKNLPAVTNEWFSKLEKKGLKVLAIWPRPFRQLSNSKKAIRTPADIKGMKYRVPGLDQMIDTFRAIGAQPVPLPASEMYTALQLGTVVGEDNAVVGVFDNKTYEVARYQMIWDYMADGTMVVINKDTWDKMPADVQKVVQTAAIDALSAVSASDTVNHEAAVKQMTAEGVTFVTLTQKERATFRELVQPVYDDMAKLLGKDAYAKFIAAVEAAK